MTTEQETGRVAAVRRAAPAAASKVGSKTGKPGAKTVPRTGVRPVQDVIRFDRHAGDRLGQPPQAAGLRQAQA
ncbi:hypothetical protein AB0G05_34850, partial [Nonomuraea wenchangensis]